MVREISEEANWKEGDGRRSEEVRQVDARGGSDGGCRDPEARTHHYEWYIERLSYQDLILNVHTSFRRKRNEASGPTISK